MSILQLSRVTMRFEAALVDRCPSCQKDLDQAAQNAQLKFQQFRQALANSSLTFEFPIRRVVPHR